MSPQNGSLAHVQRRLFCSLDYTNPATTSDFDPRHETGSAYLRHKEKWRRQNPGFYICKIISSPPKLSLISHKCVAMQVQWCVQKCAFEAWFVLRKTRRTDVIKGIGWEIKCLVVFSYLHSCWKLKKGKHKYNCGLKQQRTIAACCSTVRFPTQTPVSKRAALLRFFPQCPTEGAT